MGVQMVRPLSGERPPALDRVRFGRDHRDDAHLPFLASPDLPPDVLATILAGNALRLVPPD